MYPARQHQKQKEDHHSPYRSPATPPLSPHLKSQQASRNISRPHPQIDTGFLRSKHPGISAFTPESSSKSTSSAKTSLGFICLGHSLSEPSSSVPAPFSFIPTDPSQSLLIMSAPSKSRRPTARLETLPPDVLAMIAYQVVIDSDNGVKHPCGLIPLFLTCKDIYKSISFDNNPKLYNNLFRATFDHGALDRRYRWMVKHLASQAGRGKNVFDLFSDPRSWAIDYKSRWESTRRMQRVVRKGSLYIPGISTPDTVVADSYVVWFLLTENDGKNAKFLVQVCDFPTWIVIFYQEDVIGGSVQPGWPRVSYAKTLTIWDCLLTGTDSSEEHVEAAVDEKIFAVRPYVFACARYDIFYAPWTLKRLPMSADAPEAAGFEPKTIPYERFGDTWNRTIPNFALGCIIYFLRFIERHGRHVGSGRSSTFSTTPAVDKDPGLFSLTYIMPSIYHDREWQRGTVCQNPNKSPGLPPLTFRGELEGFWRGKCLFYDFDMYRQMLAGDMRAAYTGTFAEQAVEVELFETVIKVKVDEVGGEGPVLCAGFDNCEDGGSEEEQRRIRAGYGYQVCENENERDEPGWTKEILISGTVRGSMGLGTVRGRVRSWDGLVLLALRFSTHVLGQWIWRGYIQTGGVLTGRWRDTFTPDNLRGYEGAFGMIRSGDIFYPPNYPRSMAESAGVDHISTPGSGFASPSFPSLALLNRPLAVSRAGSPESSVPYHQSTSSRSNIQLPSIRHLLSPEPQRTYQNESKGVFGDQETPTSSLGLNAVRRALPGSAHASHHPSSGAVRSRDLRIGRRTDTDPYNLDERHRSRDSSQDSRRYFEASRPLRPMSPMLIIGPGQYIRTRESGARDEKQR